MSRCFASSSKLSAKDYTNKKRNTRLFYDLRDKFIVNGYKTTGTNNACVNNSGIILKFNSQTDQLNIKKGFEQFLSTNRKDLSQNYVGQQMKNNFCGHCKIPDINNIDVSNNYTSQGPLLTSATPGNTGQTLIVDSSGAYINKYAEIERDLGIIPTGTNVFPTGKKIIYENCGTDRPVRASGRMQVVVPTELPSSISGNMEFILV